MGKKTRKSTEQFVSDAIRVHGNAYDYSFCNYQGFNIKVEILCNKHGSFFKTPRDHVTKKRGCEKCSKETLYKNRKSLAFTTEDFITKSRIIHGDKFNYDEAIYVNSYTPLIIKCPIHGKSEIEPRHHYKGSGCYKCGRDSFSKKQRKYKNLDQLLSDLRQTHGDRYDYKEVVFSEDGMGGLDSIPILCEHHGLFLQGIRSHKEGSGCAKCRYIGYTKEAYVEYCKRYNKEFSKVYLLRFYSECESFYKIGITTQPIEERFRKKRERGNYDYEMIFNINLPPDLACDTETSIKEKFIKYSYKPKNWLVGYTECFSLDLPIEEIISYLETI